MLDLFSRQFEVLQRTMDDLKYAIIRKIDSFAGTPTIIAYDGFSR